MFAMPFNRFSCFLIQHQPEWALVLVHLAGNIVAMTELITKASSLSIKQNTTSTTQCFSSQPFHFGVWFTWIDETCWMHLHLLNVSQTSANCLSHFDTIASAMRSVCCWQMQHIRTMFGQQRTFREISTITASSNNNRTVRFFANAVGALIHNAVDDAVVVAQQFSDACFHEQLCALRLCFANVVEFLDQRHGDGHAWETLAATMSARK
mmetsp:Transcript_14285/g.24440  ORF Transcript_14285/g.24440 Transcript_14285/m.24440 type:complete len:209 (-) Transcript_14285:401-1027(-)